MPVIFTKYIQPVCLPASDNLSLPFPGVSSDVSSCHITGFGYSKVDCKNHVTNNNCTNIIVDFIYKKKEQLTIVI